MPSPFRSAQCESLELRVLLAADLVADIGTLGRGSNPAIVGTFQDEVHFVASTDAGIGLFASDGTKDGTRSLIQEDAQRRVLPSIATAFGSFFLEDSYNLSNTKQTLILWSAPEDASNEPTELLKVYENREPAQFEFFLESIVDGKQYLRIQLRDGSGGGMILVSTDGTPDGTRIDHEERRTDASQVAFFGQDLFVLRRQDVWARRKGQANFERIKDLQADYLLPLNDRLLLISTIRSVRALESDYTVSSLTRGRSARLFGANDQGAFFFVDGGQIWHTDGTQSGTRRIKSRIELDDLLVTDQGGFFAVQGETATVTFSVGNEEPKLFVDTGLPGQIQNMSWVDGRLHFALDGEYWISDGTPEGTRAMGMVLHPGIPREIENGRVLFTGSRDGSNAELWSSDGTIAGTHQVVDLYPGTHSADFPLSKFDFDRDWQRHRDFVEFEGAIYFGAEDGLYRSDGTAEGTETFFSSVPPRTLLTPRRTQAKAEEIREFEGRLYFFVQRYDLRRDRSESDQIELWVTDGQDEPKLLWQTSSEVRIRTPVDSLVIEGEFHFRVSPASHTTELWKIEAATNAPTMLVSVFASDTAVRFAKVGQHVIYLSDNELVSEDLQADEKSVLATDIDIDSDSDLLMLGDQVVFLDSASRLWTTDGTAEATPYFDLPGTTQNVLLIEDLLFTVVHLENGEEEVWRSDGSRVGTFKLGRGQRIDNVDGELYIWDRHSSPATLSRSDGTLAGTRIIRELPRQNCCPESDELIRAGDRLFSAIQSGPFGTELWILDEASEAPPTIIDLRPGTSSSYPRSLTILGQNLLFVAQHETLGGELWRYSPDAVLNADFDNNGIVDDADYLILAANFGSTNVTIDQGDTNEDGVINFADFLYLSSQFNIEP